jgi:hypothetical protein
MNKILAALVCALVALLPIRPAFAQQTPPEPAVAGPASTLSAAADIFDDKALIQGYAVKLSSAPKDLLLAMINDVGLYAYKKAAAVRVFRDKYAPQMVSRERVIIEKVLLRQLETSGVVHLQIEIMHTLVVMDRFRYYESMVPILVRKMDHYDPYVNELAFTAMEEINANGITRPREARIVFNTLRKVFFLSRKKLKTEDPLDSKLRNKFQLLRWAIKILGTDELKKLPPEVIGLM